MKYKIGELEVEAVQWNGEDCFHAISDFLDTIKFGLYGIERDKKDNIIIEDEGSQKIAFLEVGEYLVRSETSLFKLSEQDFRNMATKIKEPKFKVGDKAYNIERDSCSSDDTYVNNIKFIRHIVSKISSEDGFIYYFIKGGGDLIRYKESVLFTLEEAIEKLKEL